MTPAEIDRAEAHRAAVMAWAHRLPAVLGSPDAARRLAFGAVAFLLRTFCEPRAGTSFAQTMALVHEQYVVTILGRVCGTCRDNGDTECRPCGGRGRMPPDVMAERAAADRLGSLLLPRAAPAWTWETRAPYEVCEALRRACEAEALLCGGARSIIRCATCHGDGHFFGDACTDCLGSGRGPDEDPVTPPLLALLLHDAHALLSDLRADTAGLEKLVADAEAREREQPTARQCQAETTMRREGWER